MISITFCLLSGLVVFIYGMQVVKTGLRKGANRQTRAILKYFTGNKLFSILVGIIITVLMQSSSATIVLVISLVNAELIGLAQALGVTIGANIGTTITGQIISFNIERYFWVCFLIGSIFYILKKKQRKKQEKYLTLTKVFIGFGLIFSGLNLLAHVFDPLANEKFFLNFIAKLSQNDILAFLSGVFGTSLLQSSSAFIGVILTLAKKSLIELSTALILLLGSNVGTCITALIAAINGSLTAKTVAKGHIIFNLTGALVFLPLVTPFSFLILLTSDQLARQIANGHTFFNVINALIFYLIFDRFVKLVKN